MSADTTMGLQDPVQSVTSDLPCVGCGYNLRTLAETAVCPECARPVPDSLRFQHLHLADVDWLRRLRRGTVLMAIAAGLLATLVFMLLFLQVTAAQVGRTVQSALIVTVVLTSIAWTCGIWLATTAEPGASGSDQRLLSRWLNRMLAINSLILAVVLAGIAMQQILRPAWRNLPNWLVRLVMVLNWEMYVLVFICPMLASLYFRAIDRRAQCPGLRRTNTIIPVLMAVGLGLFLTAVIALLCFRVNLPEGIILPATCLCLIAGLVLGAFGLVGHWRLFTQAMGLRADRNT